MTNKIKKETFYSAFARNSISQDIHRKKTIVKDSTTYGFNVVKITPSNAKLASIALELYSIKKLAKNTPTSDELRFYKNLTDFLYQEKYGTNPNRGLLKRISSAIHNFFHGLGLQSTDSMRKDILRIKQTNLLNTGSKDSRSGSSSSSSSSDDLSDAINKADSLFDPIAPLPVNTSPLGTLPFGALPKDMGVQIFEYFDEKDVQSLATTNHALFRAFVVEPAAKNISGIIQDADFLNKELQIFTNNALSLIGENKKDPSKNLFQFDSSYWTSVLKNLNDPQLMAKEVNELVERCYADLMEALVELNVKESLLIKDVVPNDRNHTLLARFIPHLRIKYANISADWLPILQEAKKGQKRFLKILKIDMKRSYSDMDNYDKKIPTLQERENGFFPYFLCDTWNVNSPDTNEKFFVGSDICLVKSKEGDRLIFDYKQGYFVIRFNQGPGNKRFEEMLIYQMMNHFISYRNAPAPKNIQKILEDQYGKVIVDSITSQYKFPITDYD